MRTLITAVDYGIINTKDAFQNSFSSTFAKEPPVDKENPDLIKSEYKGKTYYIGGTGSVDFNTDINKSLFEDSKILIYTMLAKYTPTEYDAVKFFTCLPTNQYTEENVKRYKQNIMPVRSFTFQMKVDNRWRELTILDMEVFPECCSAHYALFTSKKRLYVDFGGGTVNCALYENKRLVKSRTYGKGMLKLYNELRSDFSRKYGVEEDILGLEYIIKNGYYLDVEGGKQIVTKDLDSYVKEISTLIKLDFTLGYEVVLTGGGALTVGEEFKKYVPHATISSTCLFDNVLGLYAIARKWWK